MALHPNMKETSTISNVLNGYRVYTPEEDVRVDVTSLYNKCGNDVTKMIEAIGTTLHETAGREDVKVFTDPTGSMISVTQAAQYGLHHNRQNAFLRSLDEIMAKTRDQLETHKERLNREIPYNYQSQEEFKKDVLASMVSNPDVHHVVPRTFVTESRTAQRSYNDSGKVSPNVTMHSGGNNTCACASNFHAYVGSAQGIPDYEKPLSFPKDADKAMTYEKGYPTSKYNGNYTLKRYGGSFPQHANYGFYRRYGLKGKGATTSDRHNFPMGSPPRQEIVYM